MDTTQLLHLALALGKGAEGEPLGLTGGSKFCADIHERPAGLCVASGVFRA